MCGGGGSVSSGPDSGREAMQVHGEDRTVCVWGGGRLHIPREDRTVCVCVVVGGAHTKKEPNRWWRTGHVPGEDRTVWGKLGSANQSGVAGFQNCQTKE